MALKGNPNNEVLKSVLSTKTCQTKLTAANADYFTFFIATSVELKKEFKAASIVTHLSMIKNKSLEAFTMGLGGLSNWVIRSLNRWFLNLPKMTAKSAL